MLKQKKQELPTPKLATAPASRGHESWIIHKSIVSYASTSPHNCCVQNISINQRCLAHIHPTPKLKKNLLDGSRSFSVRPLRISDCWTLMLSICMSPRIPKSFWEADGLQIRIHAQMSSHGIPNHETQLCECPAATSNEIPCKLCKHRNIKICMSVT